jgi:hypothetical protein
VENWLCLSTEARLLPVVTPLAWGKAKFDRLSAECMLEAIKKLPSQKVPFSTGKTYNGGG